MNVKVTTSSAAIVFALIANARAQTTGEQPSEKALEVPIHAFEIVGSGGYTQGFGSLQSGVDLQNVITRAVAMDVGLGYRIDPRWAVSVVGQYQEFDAQRANNARGLTTGIALTFHVAPHNRLDPWVQVGAGYRFLWETNNGAQPNVFTHGFEPGRLEVGLDYRASRDIAMGPVIGADVTLPLWQQVSGASSMAISDPRPSTFIFAALQVRFDLTDKYVGGPPPVAQAQTTQAQVKPLPPVKPVSPTLSASDEVLAACKMNLDNVDSAPKFDFDKSDLLPADIDVLQKIADCFSTGPLKNDGVMLVGRADPRGSVEYNQALGMRRAASVVIFLEQHGVDHTRIEKTSRGKADATGTDEASWALDRRVDVGRIEIRLSGR